jgi:hypothetical protein
MITAKEMTTNEILVLVTILKMFPNSHLKLKRSFSRMTCNEDWYRHSSNNKVCLINFRGCNVGVIDGIYELYH